MDFKFGVCADFCANLSFTGEGRKLTYVTDERGNRILDYSSCGYRNSEYPIPDVANAVLFHGSLGIIPLVFSAPLTMYLHWLWIKMVFVGLFCWIKELLN